MAPNDSLFAEAQSLHRGGQLQAAREFYWEVLQAAPHHGGALHMLGVIALQSDDAAQAVALLRQAAAIDADVPALHANLGFALLAADQPHDAAAAFTAALALDPALAEARTGLGEVCNALTVQALAADDAATALARVRQSLAAAETGPARRLFVAVVRVLPRPETDADFRILLTRALNENWGPPATLSPMAAALVLRGNWRDGLLIALLRATPNSNPALERLLTQTRREILASPDADGDLSFATALAWQCFLNEYVFWQDETETARAQALKARLEAALAHGAGIPPLWVILVACYFPLSSVAGASSLRQRAWPEAVTALLVQQIDEPEEEKRLSAALPALTPIASNVSCQVRQQYEENPYPRWVRFVDIDEPVTLAAYLKAKFPHTAPESLPDMPAFLSAGCGTGPFALDLARRIRHAALTAVDLSRTSLGYAARKAAEAGVTITFGQADILQIAALEQQFDLIESSGVLHHMAEPFAGWRALLGQLKPGGVMLLGFYSTPARHVVAVARKWIAQEGFVATPDGIRACRHRLMAEPDGALAPLLGWPDFYSVSACRDLLFHVRETPMSLDEIAAFLRANGIVLLGFEIGEAVLAAYHTRFPDDPAATDLGHWRDFEADHPNTFAAMYQFWVQRLI